MEKRRTQPLKVIFDNRNKNLVSFYYSEREKNKRLFIDEFKNVFFVSITFKIFLG